MRSQKAASLEEYLKKGCKQGVSAKLADMRKEICFRRSLNDTE